MMKTLGILAGILIFSATMVYAADTPVWWTIGEESGWNSWASQMVDEFEQETGIKITRIALETHQYNPTLKASLESGNPPDLWRSLGGGILESFVKQGVVHEITDLLNQDWAMERIPRNALGGTTYEGKHYGFPYTRWVGQIYINKELFQKAGVEIPDMLQGKIWTWEEFMAAIEQFKAHQIVPFALSGAEKWELSFYYMYLVDRIGGSGAFADAIGRKPGASFETKPFIEAGKYIQELVQADAFQPGFMDAEYDGGEKLFATGHAAMYLMGTWFVNDLRSFNPSLQLDTIPFPTVPEGQGNSTMVIGAVQNNWCISESSRYKDEMLQFLEFISRPESVRAFVEAAGDLMVFNVDVPEGTYDPVIMKQIEFMKTSAFMQMAYDQLSPPAFATAHLEAVAGLFTGEFTPEEAAKMQEKIAASLTE